jgi:hypothetical protein
MNMKVDGGWNDFINQRNDMIKNTTDPNLKKHFQDEINLAKTTVAAMNQPPPLNGCDNAPGGSPDATKTPAAGTPPQEPAPGTSEPPGGAPAGGEKTAATGATPADTGNSSVDLFSDKMPNGPLSQADSDKLAGQTVNALMKDFGFTREQAAGIVGNLYHESAGMNPHVNEFEYSGYHAGDPRNFGPPANNVYGYGWAQWSADRKTAYLDFAKQQGLDPGSPKANYAFLVHELKTTEAGTVDAVKKATTPAEAAVAFCTVYERAAMPNDGSRLAAAQHIYDMTA